ncbi:MAG: FAD:protein FMN transferase [Clostridia bacterium]|nr:FAD:protein FMN transferase [Clostridia bacterium]
MKKAKKKVVSIVAVVLCAAVVIGLVSYDYIKSSNEVNKTYIAMGTVISSSISGKDAEKATAEIEEAINGLETACLSWRAEESDVWRINLNAGKDVSVSRETAAWIGRALDISADSDGAFDITVGKLTQLWNIGSGKEKLPDKETIKVLLEDVGYKKVMVSNTSVKIDSFQAIDLGAIGKGIACDVIRDILKEYDVKDAVISVGGSVLIFGNKASVGIANPDNSSQYMATVEVDNQSISTSGDYERFFEAEGKKYHHILDPESGYPAVTDLRSVTVICDSGLDCDALSTACFILGYRESLELLEKYEAQAVFVFDNHTVSVTDGLKNDFKLTSNDYTVE